MSGAGKTTTAVRLRDIVEARGRVVTLLDGDAVRRDLFPTLGFSKADRDTNAKGVAWVAAEIVRHGGVVICSLISPYRTTRQQAKDLIGREHFLEVFVDTPVDVCAARDVKGLYGGARVGRVIALTGVDDPYERPQSPDITLNTVGRSVDENAAEIVRALEERGYLEELLVRDIEERAVVHRSTTEPHD